MRKFNAILFQSKRMHRAIPATPELDSSISNPKMKKVKFSSMGENLVTRKAYERQLMNLLESGNSLFSNRDHESLPETRPKRRLTPSSPRNKTSQNAKKFARLMRAPKKRMLARYAAQSFAVERANIRLLATVASVTKTENRSSSDRSRNAGTLFPLKSAPSVASPDSNNQEDDEARDTKEREDSLSY